MSDLPPTLPSTPAPTPVNPEEAVKTPALVLMLAGALDILWILYLLVTGVLGFGFNALGGSGYGTMLSGGMSFVQILFHMVLIGAMVFGGMKMKSLQSYNIAMAGAVAALLPCGCCCFATLPAGIWALMVLLKPEVKAAFKG